MSAINIDDSEFEEITTSRGEQLRQLDLGGQVTRVRFFDITPTSFQWENRVSLDAGATWYRDSAISAHRG